MDKIFRFFHHFKDKVGDTIIHAPPPDSAKQEEELKKKREQMEAEYKKRAKKCTKCGEPLSGIFKRACQVWTKV